MVPLSISNHRIHSSTKPWYGRECATARKEFIRAKNNNYGGKRLANRETMNIKGKLYRHVNRVHHRRYENSIANEIKSLKRANPKELWSYMYRKQNSAMNSFKH